MEVECAAYYVEFGCVVMVMFVVFFGVYRVNLCVVGGIELGFCVVGVWWSGYVSGVC